MPDRAQTAGFRAFATLAALTTLFVVALTSSSARAADAQVSIVNGKTTTIDKWPWQVAIVDRGKGTPPSSTRANFFCGGSLLTPEIVVTAGHCVADIKKKQIKRLELISGRTRLNDDSTGFTAKVAKIIMPLKKNGKRRYSADFGVANWDVALIRLKTPLPGQTIKIAGDDEAKSWARGQVVSTTGWGVTGAANYKASNVLRVANQVMLPNRVCRLANGAVYRPSTMNCLGGPSINSSSCFGDSGGPLVSKLGDEYRLIGLTSFGDASCRPAIPSVDARVASPPMRNWVQRTVIAETGTDPVGSGGVPAVPRKWCEVPDVFNQKVSRARAMVRSAGCRVSGIRTANMQFGKRGRAVGTSLFPGWLTPLGASIAIYVRPRTAR